MSIAIDVHPNNDEPYSLSVNNVNEFLNVLQKNEGMIFVKYEADWCAPCQKIKQDVLTIYNGLPDFVKCYIVNVDKSFELYAFLKHKKMLQGIPAIHCYKKGNITYIPDAIVVGSSTPNIQTFFHSCLESHKKNNDNNV